MPDDIKPLRASLEIDVRASGNLEPFYAKLDTESKETEWEFRTADGRMGVGRAVPGTWARRPEGVDDRILGFFCCPNCRGVSILLRQVHAVNDRNGQLSPDFRCTYFPRKRQQCPFHRRVHLDRWNHKPLWACAVNMRQPNGAWKPEIHIVHAETEAEAWFHMGRGDYQRVAAGRAIGFVAPEAGKGSILLA